MSGLLALLAGCGPLSGGNPLARGIVDAVTGSVETGAPPPPPASAASGLTREMIEAQPVDLLRVSLVGFGVTSLYGQIGQNGDRITWGASDSSSVTTQGGILIATRGMGNDLLGADVSAVRQVLMRGGSYQRSMSFLDGLGQLDRQIFDCTARLSRSETLTIFDSRYVTTIVEESCANDAHRFSNTYWRDSQGVIWQSRQWISPTAGYLGYQRL